MQMTIIFSENLQYMAMMFNQETDSLTNQEILIKFPEWSRLSEAYGDLQAQSDLAVDRIDLPDNVEAPKLAGEHLYKYLSKGYVCLGNYTGNPKPDMSHLGVLTVQRLPSVGFFINTK